MIYRDPVPFLPKIVDHKAGEERRLNKDEMTLKVLMSDLSTRPTIHRLNSQAGRQILHMVPWA